MEDRVGQRKLIHLPQPGFFRLQNPVQIVVTVGTGKESLLFFIAGLLFLQIIVVYKADTAEGFC